MCTECQTFFLYIFLYIILRGVRVRACAYMRGACACACIYSKGKNAAGHTMPHGCINNIHLYSNYAIRHEYCIISMYRYALCIQNPCFMHEILYKYNAMYTVFGGFGGVNGIIPLKANAQNRASQRVIGCIELSLKSAF